jgi:lipopolysaccharide export system protein LptA
MKAKSAKSIFLLLALFFVVATARAAEEPVTLQADTITYDTATGISTAEGHVVITQADGEARAERGSYNLKTKEGLLTGTVTARRGEATFAADSLRIEENNHFIAEGNASVAQKGDSLTAPVIEYWSDRSFAKTSGGWGELKQADGSILVADYIEYDIKAGMGLAEGNVQINSPARNITGAGEKATYSAGSKETPGEVILSGNAWMIQDGNKIMGDQLVVKSDRSTGEAKGNVKMVITPKQNAPDPRAKAKDADKTDQKDDRAEKRVKDKKD